jgi:hypothetical protein
VSTPKTQPFTGSTAAWFFDKTTHSQILIESQWDDAESESGAGIVRLRAWGKNAESLIDKLLDALLKLPVGQAPKIEGR